jgi:hypothetical protein
MKFTVCMIAAFVMMALVAAPAMAEHEHEDVEIGVNGAGQLSAHFEDWDEIFELEPVDGLLNGWLGEAPGFVHVEEDEPAADLYHLEAGVEVYLEVVAFDDAFQAWADGFAYSVSEPNDQALLGDEELHGHLDWHINSDDPLFDPLQEVWQAQFRLVDNGTTGYDPSDTYTLNFTTPEPASLVLLMLGGALGLRRRS